MSSTHFAATIDVREIPPRDRHPVIFDRFDALAPGQALQLVNDHDPKPLQQQFEARSGGHFDWAYLEAGPDLWRVRIGKKTAQGARQVAPDSCCSGGACCG